MFRTIFSDKSVSWVNTIYTIDLCTALKRKGDVLKIKNFQAVLDVSFSGTLPSWIEPC